MGLWPRDMSDVRDSPFYRPLDLSDTVRMRVVLTRAVSPGRRCPTPSSYSHSGNRTCRTAPSPAAGMALAVVLPPVAPVASSSVKACPWTGEPRTQDMSLFMGVNVGEIFAFSSKMSGRLRGREILRPFRDKCVQFRLPLGWNRPSGVDSAGLLGVDSAGPHHFDSIPPAILSGPFCLKVCLRVLGSCIVFDTEILLVGAGSLSFCMCRWRCASFKEE